MPVLYQNFQSGTLSADITNTATSFSSAGLANLQVVASPDTMWIVLDPEASAGAPEIVQVTVHTSSATSATIVRGQQGTTARAHLTGVVWRASLTKSDVVPWANRTFGACAVYQSSPQNITHNTATALNFNAEDLDPAGWHSTVSNTSHVTPTVAGWYQVTLECGWASDTDYTALRQYVTKNGGGGVWGDIRLPLPAATIIPALTCTTALISLNGSTDYVEGNVLQTNTSTGTNGVTARMTVQLVYPT